MSDQAAPDPEFGDDSFLPPDDDTPEDPDEVLDALEAEDEEDFIDPEDAADVFIVDDEPPALGLSWAFDFEGGSFVRSGAGGPLETRGLATLRGWIAKCLMIDRGSYVIHPPDYGLERPETLGLPMDDEAGANLEEAIRDALLFHPRITDVTDFVTWPGDEEDEGDPYNITPEEEVLYVSFTVVTDDEDALEFQGVAIRGA